jgi:hypothetical protein
MHASLRVSAANSVIFIGGGGWSRLGDDNADGGDHVDHVEQGVDNGLDGVRGALKPVMSGIGPLYAPKRRPGSEPAGILLRSAAGGHGERVRRGSCCRLRRAGARRPYETTSVVTRTLDYDRVSR